MTLEEKVARAVAQSLWGSAAAELYFEPRWQRNPDVRRGEAERAAQAAIAAVIEHQRQEQRSNDVIYEGVMFEGASKWAEATPMTPDWHVTPATDLEAAIAEFKAALPGWWFSVCECQVSCDASCAPTTESEDVKLIPADERFNDGFHADLPQPATLADALRTVMAEALQAKAMLAAAAARE